jgi:hypothetical protein
MILLVLLIIGLIYMYYYYHTSTQESFSDSVLNTYSGNSDIILQIPPEADTMTYVLIGGGGGGGSACFMDKMGQRGGNAQIISGTYTLNSENVIYLTVGKGGHYGENYMNTTGTGCANGQNGTSTFLKFNNKVFAFASGGIGGISNHVDSFIEERTDNSITSSIVNDTDLFHGNGGVGSDIVKSVSEIHLGSTGKDGYYRIVFTKK